jgi:hypothetical protein
MSQIDVLIIVDALGAVASGSLQNNVYLVDTNKYLGSWAEGQCELHTVCQDGQIINWRVVSVNPAPNVEIVGFTGQMIDQKICIPKKEGDPEMDEFWQGRVETRGQSGEYQYSATLVIQGRQMTFDPALDVQ